MGNSTDGISLGLVLGVIYGVAVMLFVNWAIGIASIVPIGVFYAVGFRYYKQTENPAVMSTEITLVSSAILSITFGVALGLPIWRSYSDVHLALYNPTLFGLWVAGVSGILFFLTFQRWLIYPFHLMYTIVLYNLIGRQKRWDTLRLWRCCPVYWDETLRLPMPLVTEFILHLGEHDSIIAAGEIKFLIEKRQPHAKEARDALASIIIKNLEVNSVDDISRVYDRIAWVEIHVPKSLDNALSSRLDQFREISKFVEHYLAADRAAMTERRDFIYRAVRTAKIVAESAPVNDASSIVELSATAHQWLAKLSEESKHYPEPLNPTTFIVGPTLPSGSEVFVGREEIFAAIDDWCLRGDRVPTVLFHGPGRMGKSSLLNQLPRRISKRIIPVLVDCHDARLQVSAVSHITYITRQISNALLACDISHPPLDETRVADSPRKSLLDWFDAVASDLGENKMLISLDEYETLDDILVHQWGRDLLSDYRRIMDDQHFFFMFTGRRTFANMGKTWTETLTHVLTLPLGFLREADAIRLLQVPCDRSGLTYTSDAIQSILAETRCHPYLTQAVGRALIMLLIAENRLEVVPTDIDTIISQVIGHTGTYLADCWTDSEADGQAILYAIAHNLEIPDRPTAMEMLMEDNIVGPDGRFVVPLFERYVKEKFRIKSPARRGS